MVKTGREGRGGRGAGAEETNWAWRLRWTRRPQVRTKAKFRPPQIAELASGMGRATHFSAASDPRRTARRWTVVGALYLTIVLYARPLPRSIPLAASAAPQQYPLG